MLSMKLSLLFITAAAAIAATVAVPPTLRGAKRPNYDFVKYYDCRGKPNGNYIHPYDCTRFIICSNGNAADMACPDCDLNNVNQCAGSLYLTWNQPTETCEWPETTDCVVDGGGAPTTPGRDEPTTPGREEPTTPGREEPTTPSRDEPTTPGRDEPTTPGRDDPTTPGRDDPTTPVGDAPTTPGGPSPVCDKVPGQSCSPDDCEHCGWCEKMLSYYLRCKRTVPDDPKDPITGVIVKEECDNDQWWNPDLKPPSAIVGGACDDWGNLSPIIQNKYLKDPICIDPICIFGQDKTDKCSGRYWFYDPKVHSVGQRDNLTCGGKNVWDPSTETCRKRNKVAGC